MVLTNLSQKELKAKQQEFLDRADRKTRRIMEAIIAVNDEVISTLKSTQADLHIKLNALSQEIKSEIRSANETAEKAITIANQIRL